MMTRTNLKNSLKRYEKFKTREEVLDFLYLYDGTEQLKLPSFFTEKHIEILNKYGFIVTKDKELILYEGILPIRIAQWLQNINLDELSDLAYVCSILLSIVLVTVGIVTDSSIWYILAVCCPGVAALLNFSLLILGFFK